jgi:maleylacetoacetate isomerase
VILYDYWRSSAAYRVRIVLNLKRIAYKRVAIDIAKGEQRASDFLQRNPQGLVPALDIGSNVLTQSLAIIEYLDTTHADRPMLSRDPVVRATVLAQALVIAADIHPIDNLRVLKRLSDQFGADQAAREAWYAHWLVEGLTALEAMATDLPGTFLGGDAPNLADVCLVPQLYNARRFAIPLDAFPRLVRADAACTEVDEIAAAHPDRVNPG